MSPAQLITLSNQFQIHKSCFIDCLSNLTQRQLFIRRANECQTSPIYLRKDVTFCSDKHVPFWIDLKAFCDLFVRDGKRLLLASCGHQWVPGIMCSTNSLTFPIFWHHEYAPAHLFYDVSDHCRDHLDDYSVFGS